MRVFHVARDNPKQVEISMCQLSTTDVGPSIGKPSFKAVESCRKESNNSLLLLLGGGVVKKSIAIGLVKDVHEQSIEPLGLVKDTGGSGGVAVLECEGLQDSNALGQKCAVVVDKDGELGVTVGLCFLNGSPLFHSD
jgi:hypothetical protein